jgi:micrococcal nuclease
MTPTKQTIIVVVGFLFGLSLVSSLDWTFRGLDHLPQTSSPAVSASAQTHTQQEATRCRVTQVFDGDTIECQFPGSKRRERVRLLHIDAPESKHSYKNKTGQNERGSAEATQRLSQLVLNQWVRLESDVKPFDRYGRRLAFVYQEDSSQKTIDTSINEVLLREGLVKVRIIPPNQSAEGTFNALERYAQQHRLGLWRTP